MISTPVNAEITEYREKFFGGMSIRQLVCFGMAAALAIGTAALGTFVLHLSMNWLSYAIMLEVMPFLAVGWLRFKNHYTFEQYLMIFCRWYFQRQQLPIRKEETTRYVPQKRKNSRRETASRPNPHTAAKEARKAAAAAKKEIERSERQRRKEYRKAARAQNGG